jgi:hypothetical protein
MPTSGTDFVTEFNDRLPNSGTDCVTVAREFEYSLRSGKEEHPTRNGSASAESANVSLLWGGRGIGNRTRFIINFRGNTMDGLVPWQWSPVVFSQKSTPALKADGKH